MTSAPFTIRATTPDDWHEVREIRLEMLQDTPLAYTETLEEALGHDEAEWRRRGARGDAANGISLVAVLDDGRWVGTMGCVSFRDEPWPMLVSVYVASAFRGAAAGVTDALLAEVEAWASSRASGLMLHVHEDNARARAAYERRGFVATGSTIPYPLDRRQRELEMVKRL
ncbi:GNAT family N-acetyltransferase [Pseudoclavibacter sp. RFBI5]|uniref:GNAT family N-acetyltransferase n=1 Tax=Pseudoclavibacter sp. RFBI5 TaxID=2080578 RepID=UPI000CE77AD2|nr:GNAT family N-acetyltransferase [Pseudoclavibacter sp. RFBI5]PPG04906.1 GNAT family N-acetyltransferase [Pseudoclavibacter sp. RFBI5]